MLEATKMDMLTDTMKKKQNKINLLGKTQIQCTFFFFFIREGEAIARGKDLGRLFEGSSTLHR